MMRRSLKRRIPMKTMKMSKLMSLAAAALLSVSFMAVPSAFAQTAGNSDELTDGIFTYELNEKNEYTIIKCKTDTTFSEIPSIVNGYAVTAIGEQAFVECTFLSELTIPSSVKSIGAYAFSCCSGLKKVKVKSKITELSEGVFSACSNLTEIELPDTLASIGKCAFLDCTSLETIDIPESVTTIDDHSFQGCYSLKEFNIPLRVDTLSVSALIDCAALETITADNNPNFSVKDNTLYNADETVILHAAPASLSGSLYIPDGVTEIAAGAYCYASNVTNLFFPTSLKKIGDSAFCFCTGLTGMDFAEGLTNIDTAAFSHCTSLRSLLLPTTLENIGGGAFYDCPELEKVMMCEGIRSIGTSAFLSCPKLKNTIVPKSVNDIGEYALGFDYDTTLGQPKAMSDFSMSVYSGSAAESYAKKAKIAYTSVDKSIAKTAFLIIGAGLVIAAVVFATVLMKRGSKSRSAAQKKSDELEEEKNYQPIISDNTNEE